MKTIRSLSSRPDTGFSLAEVTLSLAIAAIALVPLLGMLPVGLNTQKEALSKTVTAQVYQSIVSDLQRADFGELVDPDTLTAIDQPMRYFDEQGSEIAAENLSDALAGTGARMYDVETILTYPAPMGSDANYSVVQAEIRIARNPGGLPSAEVFDEAKHQQWERTFALIGKTSK